MSRKPHSSVQNALQPRHRMLTLMAIGLLLGCGLAVWSGAYWAARQARLATDAAAAEQADKRARQLAGALQKFRLLPLVLSEYPDVHAVLSDARPEPVARLNGKLELLAERTDAAAIYVIAPNGLTLAANNWNEPGSFVGQNFSYRPYFLNAMANGEAELFAVGSVTGRPGFFIARRIDDGARTLGVIVVKIDFADLEAQWSGTTEHTLVVDPRGVVIITDHDPWRFRATRPLTPEDHQGIRSALQFASLPLSPLRFQQNDEGDLSMADAQGRFRQARTASAIDGASLLHVASLEPAYRSASLQARLVVFAILAAALMVFAAYWRIHMGRLAQVRARQALEEEVDARTSELRDANRRLREESQGRLEADRRWRAASEELTQANRLGLIGQVTAGVAHEINQPIAAIRAFAENGVRYLQRGSIAKVQDDLSSIVSLTDRVARITTELRSFSRKRTPLVDEVSLNEALDGALLLIGDRLRTAGIRLDWTPPTQTLRVSADKMRLEQIFINLIQNAADALEGRPAPNIAVLLEVGDDDIAISIADNGPGIAPDLAGSLFTPFVTSKPTGLGLGLGIARDIAREFGGSLSLVASPLGGAAFCVRLRRA
ncbi:sensor histidine kinase [Brevundimonas guildfordensis]|uniref:histidine kinase n=1 Tax=Brevundimonas guildfordensis TaxID=2762241 RepID=A0ABR8QW95_9CAUL|nr:ATP-binding protein [Brevundimonas guildfordensis]MBD7939815.1 sensor histidine kinase [Brevundimonas guildfordensis]